MKVDITANYEVFSREKVKLPEGYTINDICCTDIIGNEGLITFNDGIELPFKINVENNNYFFPKNSIKVEKI